MFTNHETSGGRTVEVQQSAKVRQATNSTIEIVTAAPTLLQRCAKRTADFVVASTLLFISSPILLVAAILIRREDSGPALFRQQRVGRDGKLFTMFKLRTMIVEAEGQLDAVWHLNIRTGPLFKAADDPRTTNVGRMLRLTNIDELPQLWNVVKGEMSLVGPRPALPSEVAAFRQHHLVRHQVRPGITGLWQVHASHEEDFALYENLDLQYMRDWSLFGDIKILVSSGLTLIRHIANALGLNVSRSRSSSAA